MRYCVCGIIIFYCMTVQKTAEKTIQVRQDSALPHLKGANLSWQAHAAINLKPHWGSKLKIYNFVQYTFV